MNTIISSMGMISSVGRDARHACASIRAGLTRPQELTYYHVMDEETQSGVPVLGHPIRCYTEGFNMVGRWIRLAIGCLHDLMMQGNLPAKSDKEFWKETSLIGATPYINDERFDSSEDETPELMKEAYLFPLLEEIELPIRPENVSVVALGHAGAVAALDLARQILANSEARRVIVLAVDSYLDTLTLEWLSAYDRLKGPVDPAGLMPGEAGASLLLERGLKGRTKRAAVLATIEGIAVEREANNYFSDRLNRGEGLARAITSALTGAKLDGMVQLDMVTDLNGEEWRASELAGAMHLLRHRLTPHTEVGIPAKSIGDTGAASGAVSLCYAIHLFQRNGASADRCLMVSSSERGDVGAVVLRRES